VDPAVSIRAWDLFRAFYLHSAGFGENVTAADSGVICKRRAPSIDPVPSVQFSAQAVCRAQFQSRPGPED
jgi:hypothetical protein